MERVELISPLPIQSQSVKVALGRNLLSFYRVYCPKVFAYDAT